MGGIWKHLNWVAYGNTLIGKNPMHSRNNRPEEVKPPQTQAVAPPTLCPEAPPSFPLSLKAGRGSAWAGGLELGAWPAARASWWPRAAGGLGWLRVASSPGVGLVSGQLLAWDLGQLEWLGQANQGPRAQGSWGRRPGAWDGSAGAPPATVVGRTPVGEGESGGVLGGRGRARG